MIIEIVVDMRHFFGVLMIGIMATTNAFYIIGNPEQDFGNFVMTFIYSYRMGIGDFDFDSFGAEKSSFLLYILFMISTLFILLILLNMLIAMMGDTFDRVQETSESNMLKEFTEMMIENEYLFNRKKLFKGMNYIIVIQNEKASQSGGFSWEGKINYLKKFIEESFIKSTKENKEMKEVLIKQIDDKSDLNEMVMKVKEIERNVNSKVESLSREIIKLGEKFDAQNRKTVVSATEKEMGKGLQGAFAKKGMLGGMGSKRDSKKTGLF
jgi:hypothetical protein